MSYNALPVWRQFLLTCEDDLLGGLAQLVYLCLLFEEASMLRHLKKLLPLILFPFALAAYNWSAMRIIVNLPLVYTIFALDMLALTLWSMWVWRRSFWQGLSAVCIAGMLQSPLCIIFYHLFGIFLPLEEMESVYPGVSLLLLWAVFPVHFVIATVLKRLGFGEKFRAFMEGNGNIRRTALLLAALEAVFVALYYMQYGVQPRYLAEYLVVAAVMMLLVVALVFHLAQRDIDRQKLKSQQEVIAWQQVYERSLEELRQEMRTFRHDYRNLIAGFAGNMENDSLRCSLQELESGFDRRLGEKIQVSVQIGNLRIPQVRSLMLDKMSVMSGQGVECRLEALYPVERIHMDTWDFVRCLGILVDNAIEAAAESRQEIKQPWVEIIFLQEENTLTLRVSNPWIGEIDRAGLWAEGYSTKGRGRGLGLYSYQRILQDYPHAFTAASWGDGVFVQELIVGRAIA